ncbi:hypothetical protein Tco_0456626 [Tanacetum coccineum]
MYNKGEYGWKRRKRLFYQHQEAGKQEKNQMGLLTMDDGIVNWGEHTEAEESNHALMAISSSNEVSFEGSCGNTSEHSFETESEILDEPNEMSKSRLEVTNEKDVSVPKSSEVAPSYVSHIKTPRQPLKDNETHKVNRKSWNDMM